MTGMTRKPDAITRLFRACDPGHPLKPGDDRYVDLAAVRGEEDVVFLYERAIRRADPEGREVKLFCGHRGVGKTSELLRLQQRLTSERDGQPAFRVVYLDVSLSLDPNDLDFPDLLVAVAAAVQEQLAAAKVPGFRPTSVLLKSVWDDLRATLKSEVTLSEAEVSSGFAALTLELRNRPGKRKVLRDAIERFSTPLLEALNDLLGLARVKILKQGGAGLVILVDGLDKLVRRPLEEGTTNTHERLFIDRSEQLAALDAHLVYTVPISLIYSPRCADLEQSFGEHNVPLSMIRLRGPDRLPVQPVSPGMLKMLEILEKRCWHADVAMDEAFENPETAEYLCAMSGGHPRHLMMFVQAATNIVDALPITRDAAGRAVHRYGNSLLREVRDEVWPALRRFGEPQDEIPKDDLHQEMLFLLYVFEYMNGDLWYEVNPVFRTLERFNES